MRDLSDAIAYCRVSTEKQADLGSALERYVQNFIRYGFEESQIYYDIASGGNDKREGYLRALEAVKQGKKRVFVPELSRFSRSVKGFEEAIAMFKDCGAKLLSLDGHDFDLVTPTGLTNTRIMMVFAEQARLTRQYQSIEGFKNLREKGRPVRAIAPYVIEEKDRFVRNTSLYKDSGKTYWEVAREIVEYFLEKKSFSVTIAWICEQYGTNKIKGVGRDFPRDVSGLKYWLCCQTLRGNIEYFGARRYRYSDDVPDPILVPNTHEALIGKAEAYEIESILQFNKSIRSSNSKVVNPFIGKAFCVCGAELKKVHSHPKGSRARDYMVCRRAYPNSPKIREAQKRGESPICDRRSSYGLTLKGLEEAVIKEIQGRVIEVADFYFPETGTIENPKLIVVEAEIQKLERLIKEIPDIKPVLEKKIRERDVLMATTKTEGNQEQILLRRKLIEYALDDGFWGIATVNEKRILFGELVQRIVCDKGQLQISLAI